MTAACKQDHAMHIMNLALPCHCLRFAHSMQLSFAVTSMNVLSMNEASSYIASVAIHIANVWNLYCIERLVQAGMPLMAESHMPFGYTACMPCLRAWCMCMTFTRTLIATVLSCMHPSIMSRA